MATTAHAAMSIEQEIKSLQARTNVLVRQCEAERRYFTGDHLRAACKSFKIALDALHIQEAEGD